MLFNKDVLYLHVPKTGGNSMTKYLAETLSGPIYYVRKKPIRAEPRFDDPDVIHIFGRPHDDLAAAKDRLEGYGLNLETMPLILTTIRNPYDMEVSAYCFLRPTVSPDPSKVGEWQRIAMTLDFSEYISNRFNNNRITGMKDLKSYYYIEGNKPVNMTITRFENLVDDAKSALSSIGIEKDANFPWINRSSNRDYVSYYTPETEEIVYQNHRWIFDQGYYSRLVLDDKNVK